MRVPTGESTAVMIGRVLVVRNDEAVFGADPGTGRQLWRLPSAGLRVSGDLIVLLERGRDRVEAFSVADPATGRILWREDSISRLRVAEDAIFTVTCPKDECIITRHDRRSGRPRWSVRSGDAWLTNDDLGARLPFTSAIGSYLFTELREDDQGFSLGARDTASGRLVRGRITGHSWYEVVVGRTLVASDHDPPDGDDRCTVTLTAVDAGSGRRKGRHEVFSGRRADGTCQKWLAESQSGHLSFIGAGSRIAASTEDGYPQVFDLETGRTVWRGDTQAVPIDGDGRTLLVRRYADRGSLALLDFSTGRRLWTAPDPGLEGSSASWQTAVTGRLVAVSGAVGTRPHVLVYRADDGRRVGRFPGWLEGLGEDWAAIGHSSPRPVAGRLQFDFIRL